MRNQDLSTCIPIAGHGTPTLDTEWEGPVYSELSHQEEMASTRALLRDCILAVKWDVALLKDFVTSLRQGTLTEETFYFLMANYGLLAEVVDQVIVDALVGGFLDIIDLQNFVLRFKKTAMEDPVEALDADFPDGSFSWTDRLRATARYQSLVE